MTLRTRLDDLAADAPGADALDLLRLRGRIARRRRGRLAAAGGAAVLTVAAIGTVAATLLPDGNAPVTPPVAAPSPLSTLPLEAYPFPGCGTPFALEAPLSDPGLTMDVDFASPVANLDDELGDVTITNVSDARIQGGAGAGPSLIVTQDGRVVGGPVAIPGINLPVDLDPGESMTFQLGVGHGHCDRGSVTQVDTQFPPGRYDVYVGWQLNPEVPGRNEPDIRLFDGPYEIVVR